MTDPTDVPEGGAGNPATPGDADELFDVAERRAGAKHAAALKAQATAGGLRLEAFLPSDLALWLLDLIEKGMFKDPSEAVFVMLGEQQELAQHADLRRELLRRSLDAAANDPRPGISAETVMAERETRRAAPRPMPAVWQRPDPNVARPA